MVNNKILDGKTKWFKKNRVYVTLLIKNPTQIKITIELPIYSITHKLLHLKKISDPMIKCVLPMLLSMLEITK